MGGLLVWGAWLAAQPQRYEFARPHMGTLFRIVLYASDSAAAAAGAAAAFGHIARLDSLLSDFRADSEVSLLSQRAGRGQPVRVSAELWTLLLRARSFHRATRGRFDVTIGPLSRLWRQALKNGRPPPRRAIRRARRKVGFRHLTLNPRDSTVCLHKGGMLLDFGAIAKGYALDAAGAELRRRGLPCFLLEGGGDLLLGAPPPHRTGWAILVPKEEPDSLQRHLLAHCGLATSGDWYQRLDFREDTFSHILVPKRGMGKNLPALSTVRAADATTADALATALLLVKGPRRQRRLLKEFGGRRL